MWNESGLQRSLRAAAGAVVLTGMCVVAGCGTDDDKTIVKNKTTPAVTPITETSTATVATETTTSVTNTPGEVTYQDAEAVFLAGRYDQAVAMFTSYTERKPDNAWGHYMLGLSAWKDGSLAIAEASFKRALALDSTHVKSRINLTRVLLDAYRPEEAYTIISQALTLDDQSGDAHRLKGRVCQALGRIDEAVAAYRRAIQLDPQDAWSMNNLAFIDIEQERFEESLPALARAVELRPDVAVFWNNLGMALERTGHVRAAETAYASGVSADPSNQKVALNGERVAAVREDVSIAPVDLNALARGFESEIQDWKVAAE